MRDNRRSWAVAQENSFWLNLKAHIQWGFGWIAKTATVSNLVALIWIGLSIVICGLVARDLARDVVTIEPISVPKSLSDDGYTPEVASHRLRDALNGYAGTNKAISLSDNSNFHSNLDLNIAARDELPDFVVPTIGLSLNAIVSSIRGVLHYRDGPAISGEVIFREKFALRVRVDSRQVYDSGFESANPDELMTRAAPAVMEIIKPSVNADVLYRDHRQRSLLKADDIIARFEESDVNVQWAYVLKGNNSLEQGDYAEAEKMFRKAISLNWNNPQPHNQLGLALQHEGRLEEAIVQFRRVIGMNPKSAIAYNNIGVALAEKAKQGGKLDNAIEEYRRAIAVDPHYPLPYNNLGLALSHQGGIDEAIAAFRRAIFVDPKYLHAHWNLAFALRKQRNFDAALAEYHAAIDCTKDTTQLAILHGSLGDVLKEKAGASGNLDDAIAEYRHAIDIDPAYSWAHNNLGLILRDQGKLDEAIAEFRSAAQADPKNETVKTNLDHALRVKEASASKD